MSEAPAQGIYPGIPAIEYHAWDAQNFSSLKLANRTLAHYRYEKTHPREQTAAMALGQATHCAVLEPERFAVDYAAAPECDRRTKVGKATWAEFVLEHGHAEALKAEDFALCQGMSAAAWAHPLASEILKGAGANEVSALWVDPETGLPSKCRPDRITTFDGWTHVVDVKTAQDASPRGFRKAIANFDYHQQAAWYLDGLSEVEPRERRFTFIAIESKPPHCVAVYSLDEWAIEQGRDELRDSRLGVAAALESNEWPGYANEILTLDLPQWRQRKDDA